MEIDMNNVNQNQNEIMELYIKNLTSLNRRLAKTRKKKLIFNLCKFRESLGKHR